LLPIVRYVQRRGHHRHGRPYTGGQQFFRASIIGAKTPPPPSLPTTPRHDHREVMRPEGQTQEDSVHARSTGLSRTQVSFPEVFVCSRSERRGRGVELVGNSSQNVVPK